MITYLSLICCLKSPMHNMGIFISLLMSHRSWACEMWFNLIITLLITKVDE